MSAVLILEVIKKTKQVVLRLFQLWKQPKWFLFFFLPSINWAQICNNSLVSFTQFVNFPLGIMEHLRADFPDFCLDMPPVELLIMIDSPNIYQLCYRHRFRILLTQHFMPCLLWRAQMRQFCILFNWILIICFFDLVQIMQGLTECFLHLSKK